MPDERFSLYEPNRPGNGPSEWLISFEDRDRIEDQFFRVRNGTVHLYNIPLLIRQCFDREGKDQIRTEIEIGEWLGRRLGESHYPHTLSRLVAFKQQDDPYRGVTVFTWRGVPMAELLQPEYVLAGTKLITAAQQIFAAVDHLATARVVHGRIGPATVQWDDSEAQLVDFRHAGRIGGRRSPVRKDDPWASPEQLIGIGEAHPGDDVYCAAMLVFRLATGEDPGPAAEMRRRLAARAGWLQNMLADVFAEHADQRPPAGEMLTRLAYRRRRPDSRTAGSAAEDRARQSFRELRRRQREYAVQLRHELAEERRLLAEDKKLREQRTAVVEQQSSAPEPQTTPKPLMKLAVRFPRIRTERLAPLRDVPAVVWILAASILAIVIVAVTALVNGAPT